MALQDIYPFNNSATGLMRESQAADGDFRLSTGIQSAIAKLVGRMLSRRRQPISGQPVYGTNFLASLRGGLVSNQAAASTLFMVSAVEAIDQIKREVLDLGVAYDKMSMPAKIALIRIVQDEDLVAFYATITTEAQETADTEVTVTVN